MFKLKRRICAGYLEIDRSSYSKVNEDLNGPYSSSPCKK